MATGDIVSAIIDPLGYIVWLKIAGLSTGGAYDLVPFGVPNLTLSVTSGGFGSNGSAVNQTRTIYGTRQMCLPTGASAASDHYMYTIPGTVTGCFADTETVTQSGGWSATVVTAAPCSPLCVRNQSGTFTPGATITGGTSGATMAPSSGASPTQYTADPTNREGLDGSNVWIGIALSEPVYAEDSSYAGVFVTASQGIYTQGGTPNNALTTSLSATNLSTLTYPTAIARWATVPQQRITQGFTVEAVAFNQFAHYGQAGNPLACMVFTASDQHSNTVTGTVTSMTVSTSTNASGLATPVYAWTPSLGTLTQSDQITFNFAAYPNIGTSSNGVFTTSGGTTSPSSEVGPLVVLNDKNGTYGQTVAFVDPTSSAPGTVTGTFQDREQISQATSGAIAQCIGSFTTGPITISAIVGVPDATHTWTGAVSGATLVPTAGPSANASGGAAYDINSIPGTPGTYAAVGAALNGIAAYNNTNHSRNTVDAATVYLMNGDHLYNDTAATGGGLSNSTCWFTVTRAPGLATGKARIFSAASPPNNKANMTHFYDLDTYQTGSKYVVYSSAKTGWLDSCRLAGDGSSSNIGVLAFPLRFVTNNASTTAGNPLAPFSASASGLTRGNNCTGMWQSMNDEVCVLSNKLWQNISADTNLLIIANSAGFDAYTNPMVAYNYLQTSSGGASLTNALASGGFAFVGNVTEDIATGANQNNTARSLWADYVTNNANNVIIFHNTTAGNRSNTGYNDKAPASTRYNWTCKFNADNWLPIKSDSFDDASYPNPAIDPTRNLNWPFYYGALVEGNHEESITADSLFPPKYRGVGSTTNSPAGYANNQASTYSGVTGGGAGNGDYHPAPGSVLIGKIAAARAVIPFDLYGTPIRNDGTGSAGAVQPLHAATSHRTLTGIGV
jgi:hypothetical protein